MSWRPLTRRSRADPCGYGPPMRSRLSSRCRSASPSSSGAICVAVLEQRDLALTNRMPPLTGETAQRVWQADLSPADLR
jgi:hypothetical protein